MATWKFKGLETYERKLSQLSSRKTIAEMAGRVIHKGAGIVADAIREAITDLPVVDHRQHGSESSKLRGVTSAQKKGLLDGFGITPMSEEDDTYNVKLGFDGYNSVKTAQNPDGQPNAMVARAVNSGTSIREKIPFVDQAAKKAKPIAEQAMGEEFDSILKEVWEGD